jgi:hypothetical protein
MASSSFAHSLTIRERRVGPPLSSKTVLVVSAGWKVGIRVSFSR